MKDSLTILSATGSLLLAALSSCTTHHAIKPGHALIEFDRSGESQARILHPKFVSVSGKTLSSAKRGVQLPEGPQEVTIRFAFQGGADQDAKLSLKVRANERYSVCFTPFPYSIPNLRKHDIHSLFGEQGEGLFILPANLLKIYAERGRDYMENRSREVEWAYIRVFPSDIAGGVVAEVRVP